MRWLTSSSSRSNAGCLQRDTCKRCVCGQYDCVILLEKAQLRLIYVAGWATLRERGGALSLGFGCPTRVLPGPASVRAPPTEVKSRSSGTRRRLTRPWSRPHLLSGMRRSPHAPSPRCAGAASRRVGKLPPPSCWSGGRASRFGGHRVRGRAR
jgi:hypothetical protein